MWLPRDKSTITEVFWFISSFLVLILFYFIQPIPTINHSPVIHWLLHTFWTQNESIQWSKFCPFQNSSHCSWKGQMSILYPLHLNERLWKKHIHDMYFITCFIYMHIYIDTLFCGSQLLADTEKITNTKSTWQSMNMNSDATGIDHIPALYSKRASDKEMS